MSDELIEQLRSYGEAYSEEFFPTPPPEERALDCAAAHVMRRLAVPIILEAADALAAAEARIEAHERVLRWVAHDDPKGWADAHAEACNDSEMNAAVLAALTGETTP